MFINQLENISTMKKILVVLTAIILSSGSSVLMSQNTITTIKGDVFSTSEFEILNENNYKELKYLNKKGKYRFIDFDEVYSIKTSKEKSVVYQPQGEFDLSKAQMKNLVKGRIDGKEAGSFWAPFLITYAATSSMGFLDQGDLFAAPLVPLGTTITIGIFGWSAKPKVPSDNEYYTNGYKEQRAFRMIKASLLGGGAGLITASGINILRNN